jgi:ABC-type histidine transport system ATPase subunit
MLLVTHERGFAHHATMRAIFLADSQLHEDGTSEEVLRHPK